MFVRVTIELYIVQPDVKSTRDDAPDQTPSHAGNNALKAALCAELEAGGGFENYKQNPQDCKIAERLLDKSHSFLESLGGDDFYLLHGYLDGDILYVFIRWTPGQQPYVCWIDSESTSRRVK